MHHCYVLQCGNIAQQQRLDIFYVNPAEICAIVDYDTKVTVAVPDHIF